MKVDIDLSMFNAEEIITLLEEGLITVDEIERSDVLLQLFNPAPLKAALLVAKS